jgi:serine/threonine-protein kinase
MDASEPGGASLLAGRYRLGRVIARGGSGVVYDARDERVGSEVAIKVLRRSLTADATAVARMVREVELVARLKHPNVVRVLDVGTEAEEPFLVMELLEGKTLAERVETEGALSLESVRTIASQLLDALAAVHRAGVLHRDLKPANVFLVSLRGAELVKLLDFGHGALHDGSSPKLTQSGFFAGTPGYIAPERLLGGAHDVRSDVYGVAVCLYEALAGRAAFHAASPLALHAAIVQGSAPPLSSLRTDVPEELAAVIARAMHVDPALRFESASALAGAIEAAIGAPRASIDPYAKTLAVARHAPTSTRDPARAPEPAPTPAAPPRRAPISLLVTLLAAAALATLGVVLLQRGDAAARDAHAASTPRPPAESPATPAQASGVTAQASGATAQASGATARASETTAQASETTAQASADTREAAPRTTTATTETEVATTRERRAGREGARARTREPVAETAAPRGPDERAPSSAETSDTAGEATAPSGSRSSHPDEIFVPSWAE